MLNKEEFKLTKGTGGLAFLLALLIPQLVGGVGIMIVAFIMGYSQGVNPQTILTSDSMLFASLAITQVIMGLVIVFVCKGGRNAVKISRFSAPKSGQHSIMTILLFIGIFFGLSITASLFLEFLGLFGYTPTATGFPSIDTLPKYLLAIVVVAILPAVFEELLFRGVILNSLMPFGKWVAIIFSGFLFMLMHASPMQTLYQFLIGMVLALVVIKTGNIFYTMLLHFLNNFLAITFEYFNVFSSESEFPVFLVVGSLLLFIVGIVFFLRENDAIVKIDDKCFENIVLSDDERMNKILVAKEKSKRSGDNALMIISYAIGILFCVMMWSMMFVEGLPK
ncbi:MAG: CPBP family intramembrane glutamic endopeptidase [Clostridia bacterium]